MGIMDSIKSKVSEVTQGGKEAEAFSQILSQSGGIQGLIQSFQQHGLGNVIQSWIGNGENLPISSDQLRSVLGEDKVAQVSQKIGMQPDDLLQKMSHFLPQAVNHLTPEGQVQPEKFSAAGLLSMGKNLFKGHERNP